MAISAQDKILYVANKLGLTSLQNMQGSTGAVYDVDIAGTNSIFTSASQHLAPSITNVNDNRFEVNEALLVECVGFFIYNSSTGAIDNFTTQYGSGTTIVWDLVIGNKTVMKDMPVFGGGSPYTFATSGVLQQGAAETPEQIIRPRHQTFLEGAGILIPPQVEWLVNYKLYNAVTGANVPISETWKIGVYLFGTKVLLNFNTTL